MRLGWALLGTALGALGPAGIALGVIGGLAFCVAGGLAVYKVLEKKGFFQKLSEKLKEAKRAVVTFVGNTILKTKLGKKIFAGTVKKVKEHIDEYPTHKIDDLPDEEQNVDNLSDEDVIICEFDEKTGDILGDIIIYQRNEIDMNLRDCLQQNDGIVILE